jgi:histone H2A
MILSVIFLRTIKSLRIKKILSEAHKSRGSIILKDLSIIGHMTEDTQSSPLPTIQKKERKPSQSGASRAGLKFSPARVLKKQLKGRGVRVGKLAPVYLAAVVEYLVAELVELSGSEAMAAKKNRITPLFIHRAVANDDQLLKVFGKSTVYGVHHTSTVSSTELPKSSSSYVEQQHIPHSLGFKSQDACLGRFYLDALKLEEEEKNPDKKKKKKSKKSSKKSSKKGSKKEKRKPGPIKKDQEGVTDSDSPPPSTP